MNYFFHQIERILQKYTNINIIPNAANERVKTYSTAMYKPKYHLSSDSCWWNDAI